MDPIVTAKAPLNFVPFSQPSVSHRLPGIGVWGITETVNYIKDNVYINFQFDGQEIAGRNYSSQGFKKGYRAIGNGAGDFPEWRWLWWITGYVDGFTSNASAPNKIFTTNAYAAGITAGHPSYGDYSWDRWTVETSIAEWYKWGMRKFWIHQPFGKISRNRSAAKDVDGNYLQFQPNNAIVHLNAPHQEALHYQPDQYYATKHGSTCPFTGQFGNVPMPWLTDDFVDGKTQGFVPLFKALITGTAGDLPNDVWERLTGIGGPSAWFDPSDPIEVVVYNGAMNGETFRKWRRWFEGGNGNGTTFLPVEPIFVASFIDGEPVLVPPTTQPVGWNGNIGGTYETEGMLPGEYAEYRLRESLEPFRRAGMRLGLDALTQSPGPTAELNNLGVPAKTFDGFFYVPASSSPKGISYGRRLDNGLTSGWYKFYKQYIERNFGKENIFCEAYPFTIRKPPALGGGWTANPYLEEGINIATSDEFMRAAFGTDQAVYDPPMVFGRERGHYLEEYGPVEIVRSPTQWGPNQNIGWWSGLEGKTYDNGRYWYLLPFANYELGRYDDGSAVGSGLQPYIPSSRWDQGDRYLRVDGFDRFGQDLSAGYGTQTIVGDAVIFDMLSRYQVNGQDAGETGGVVKGVDRTGILRDRTKPKTLLANSAKRRLITGTSKVVFAPNDPGNPTPGSTLSIPVLGRDMPAGGFTLVNGVTFFPTSGVTEDFNGRYPTIREFASSLVAVLTGTQTLNPQKPNYRAPQTVIDSGSLAADLANDLSRMNRVENINGVMWLEISAFDNYAGTNLGGISGGQFYIPDIQKDIPRNKLYAWLDTELLNWKRRYGFYPTYIAWNLTEYGFSGVNPTTGEPNGFELERYFFLPKTIPNYIGLANGEEREAYKDRIDSRRHLYWGAQIPGITWDASTLSEVFVNKGYDIGYIKETTPGAFEVVEPDPLYVKARDITVDLVQKTKHWRDTRGLSGSSKVTVYHIPYLPPYALPVNRIIGQEQNATFTTSDSGNWNDTIWPKGMTVNNPTTATIGVVGWYTQAETELVKKCVKLEYRKRYEPVVKELEALFPEDYDRGKYHLQTDVMTDSWIEAKRETLNLCNDFKAFSFWNTTDGDMGNPGSTPWTASGEIIPLICQTHIGIDNTELIEGDPKTQKYGTLFDYNSYNYRLIDWVRDDLLRPKGRTGTVQGMSIWDAGGYNIFTAIRGEESTYTGRTADRENILKWLRAEYGNGATIDWGNSGDVNVKVRQYFSLLFNLNRTLLNRFRRGIPRYDVVYPYNHVPFAASWSTGYGKLTGYALGHPRTIGPFAITDVVPMVYAGESADTNQAILRYEIGPGYTGNIPTGYFNNILKQYSNIPAGKRVLLPYYWHNDPIADQFTPTEYYKATADGSTYTGSLPPRDHETVGQIKFNTPWAFVQLKDAKDSVTNFLDALYATGGKIFDYVADDAESWGLFVLGSPNNAFNGPFGPTGMPAGSTSNPGVLGSYIERYPIWKFIPDNRQTRTIFNDARFTGVTNSYNGLSFSASLTQYYKSIIANAPNMVYTNTDIPSSTNITNSTAGSIIEFYTREGVTGISAATGPAWAAAYGPPYNSSSNYDPANSGFSAARNPWRAPWTTPRLYNSFAGVQVNKYISWQAWDTVIRDYTKQDLKVPLWVDTIEGFTTPARRKTKYSHYESIATGITEGSFAVDGNGHPRIGNKYRGMDIAPETYGTVNIQNFGYYPNPTTDRQRFNFENNTALAGVSAFTTGNTGAKSYIALLREMIAVRGMQRNYPDYWIEYNPWVTSPYALDGFNGFRADQTNIPTVADRTDPRYWRELIRHLFVSGADHFNYFHIQYPTQSGYTAGITEMQGLINDWKSLTDGKRVQPVAPQNGFPISPTNPPDRIQMNWVGGSHLGATGILINGAKILKKGMNNKVPIQEYGSTTNTDYIWRLTAAPQGSTLYRVSNTISRDLPYQIPLGISGTVPFLQVQNQGVSFGDFAPFAYNAGFGGGTVSTEYTSEGVVLLTIDNIAGSGAELRHGIDNSDTPNPSTYSEQPYLLGSGRPASFQFRGRFVGNAQVIGGFPNGGSPSVISGALVGFYDLGNPFATYINHFVNGNLFGLNSAVCFLTIGGSLWQTLVMYRNPSTGKYHSRQKFLDARDSSGNYKYPASADKTLKIDVNPEGTEAKFYIDGELVDTVNQNSTFVIRGDGPNGTDSPGVASLPVGQFKGNGVWGGCAVRQFSRGAQYTPGFGIPPTGNAFALLVKNPSQSPFLPTRLLITGGTSDAVVLADSGRGAWIKRKLISDAPVYSITDPIPDQTPNPVNWQNIVDSTIDNFGVTGNTQTILGINRGITLGIGFGSLGTYGGNASQLRVIRNGSQILSIGTRTRPQSIFTFTVVPGDQIAFNALIGSSIPQQNYDVFVYNSTNGTPGITLDLFNVSTAGAG